MEEKESEQRAERGERGEGLVRWWSSEREMKRRGIN